MVARFAIEELRKMVRYFSVINEEFNQSFTHEELLKIWTFCTSEQGGRVHECADSWPDYLLDAVLGAALGTKLPEDIIERAGKEC